MYEIVEYEGLFAVKSLFDNTIIKSKESSKVIGFKEKARAEHLYNILQRNHQDIVDASRFWLQKENDNHDESGYLLARVE